MRDLGARNSTANCPSGTGWRLEPSPPNQLAVGWATEPNLRHGGLGPFFAIRTAEKAPNKRVPEPSSRRRA